MVAPEFQLFQAYRQKAAALRSATQDTLEIFSNIGNFSSANDYLLKRAGISNRLQDRLKRGDKQIKPLLQSLIKELNAEIKELDSMLSSISVFGGDVFRNFQQSAISHQKIQSDILSELYELGIDYLHAIDDQIHARTTSVEQAHHRFREKLQEILIAITNKSHKALFIDTWIDCMEFLILYIRDDMELALPRHTYIELIEQESYGPAKTVLSKYFTSGAGEHYISKFEKAGMRRRVRDDDRNKDKYINLDADKQKEVDEVVKESLLQLLNGVEFEHPNTRQRFTWEQIEKIIKEEIFKGDSKITKDIKESLEKIVESFYTKLIKEYGAFALSGEGFNSFILKGHGDNSVSVGKVRSEDYLKEDSNLDELKELMKLMETAVHNSNVLESLVNQGYNSQLFVGDEQSNDSGDFSGSRDNWFKGVEALSTLQEFLSVVNEMLTLCSGLKEESLYSESIVTDDSQNSVTDKITQLRDGTKRIAKSISSKEYVGTLNKQEALTQMKNLHNSLSSVNKNSSKNLVINVVNQVEAVLNQIQNSIN